MRAKNSKRGVKKLNKKCAEGSGVQSGLYKFIVLNNLDKK